MLFTDSYEAKLTAMEEKGPDALEMATKTNQEGKAKTRSKTIDDSIRLIILDCYDTLFIRDKREQWVLRKGVKEFLDYYKNKKLAISSDSEKQPITDLVKKYYLEDYFKGNIYGEEIYDEDTEIKHLDQVLYYTQEKAEHTLFIGDDFHNRDSASAKTYGIKFIKVPNGKEDETFDFRNLIST